VPVVHRGTRARGAPVERLTQRRAGVPVDPPVQAQSRVMPVSGAVLEAPALVAVSTNRSDE